MRGVDDVVTCFGCRPVRARSLAAAVAAGLALTPVAAATAGASTTFHPLVEASRQVTASDNQARLFTGPQVAVDPTNPNRVTVAVGDFRNGGCGLYSSTDAGLSFTRAAETLLPTGMQYCSNLYNNSPYISPAFAADGTLYVALNGTSGPGDSNRPETPLVASTTDLGFTHQTAVVVRPMPVQVGGQTVMQDYHSARLAVDPANPKRLYVGWELETTSPPGAGRSFPSPPVQTLVSTSADGGLTWKAPVDLTKASTGLSLYGSGAPDVVVGPDGAIHAFSEESPPRASSGPSPVDRFIEFTSSDSGVHWKARVVPNGAGTSFVDPPVAAVDPGTGKLYVAWNQDGPKGTAVKSTIYLSSSADGGATWTRPVDLVDPAAHARSDAYSPGISVAPDGRVDVAWDDFRSDPQRTGSIFSGAPTLDSTSTTERLFDVYASSSLDSARTWSADYRVSDRSIDDVYGVTFSDRLFAPIGMASTNDALYVSWADSRNSREPTAVDDAYFTRVEAHPAALSGAAVGRSAGSAASWALIGAGGLLALLGLGLLVGSRRRSFGSPGRGAHPSS